MGSPRVTAFAPASVSNVACGYDVLGFALEGLGDEVEAWRVELPGVSIASIEGDGGRLPLAAALNSASVAASALLACTGASTGVQIAIRKGLPLSSGLGSSGASATAAVVAVNSLLGLEQPLGVLLTCAMEGERAACGSAHPDNVAPALYGGFVLVRDVTPPDVVRLPVPAGLTCAVVRPHVEVSTAAARQLIADAIPLAVAVRQWANLGACVSALHTSDFSLLARSLVDLVAEPARAGLVPGFLEAKRAAVAAGALGASFSGAGPSTFALCRNVEDAHRAADAMVHAFSAAGLDADRQVSAIGGRGAELRVT